MQQRRTGPVARARCNACAGGAPRGRAARARILCAPLAVGVAQRHLHSTYVTRRAVHEHQRAMVCSRRPRQNFFGGTTWRRESSAFAQHACSRRPRATRVVYAGTGTGCVRVSVRSRTTGVNVAIASVNVCNSCVAYGRHSATFSCIRRANLVIYAPLRFGSCARRSS